MAIYVNGRASFPDLHEEILLHQRLANEQKKAIACLQDMVLQLNGGADPFQPPGDLLLTLGWKRSENGQSIRQWVDPLNGEEVVLATALYRAFLRYRDYMEKPSLYAQLISDEE